MERSMEAEGPLLDFPTERVWDLLEELHIICLGFLMQSRTVVSESLENHRRVLTLQLLDSWSNHGESAKDKIRVLLSQVTARRNPSTLLPFLEDMLLSFRIRPLWIQAIMVCVWCFVIQRFLAAARQQLRRRHKIRRRLSMKTGRSEILQGRTSLVYGSAGDLMDEEYLEDAALGGENHSGRGGRGRFGTFDFFGINTTSNNNNNNNNNNKLRRRNRKRSQSFGDDSLFEIRNGGGHTQRHRTRSTESLGSPSGGAALIRNRTDSMESLSDTLGGFFQGLKGYSENSPNDYGHRANLPKILDKTSPIRNEMHKNNNITSAFDSKHKNKNRVGNYITSDKTVSPRFRKDRLGSMDVYFAQGKIRSPLTAREDYERGDSGTLSSCRDALGFEGQGENDFEHFGNNNDGMRYLYDEFGVVTLSHKVEYHGPFRPILNCGSTLVPPPTFEVVSRKIASSEFDLPLKRILKMDLLRGVLRVIEPTTTASKNQKYDIVYDDMDKISMQFKPPLEGGVVFLYKKGTPEHGPDWKEHTFESAHAAAQFQLDLMAYQVLGNPLRYIFEALHLIHQGSIACDKQEFVLHDKRREAEDDNNTGESAKHGESKTKNKAGQTMASAHCVAWDDAMRAMSSIPTVRIALERLWLSHKRPSVIGGKTGQSAEVKSKIALENEKGSGAELSLLKEEYIKKRLLLGPVDFYRLFVPTLPETAIPEGDFNNRGRMEQLLCWRKRVARASVLVRSYTRARLVANRGWNLDRSLPSMGTSDAAAGSAIMGIPGDHKGEQITKRLAYDGNEHNHLRDIAAKNEIYEASVSRDVLCHVRPFDFLNHNLNDGKPQKGGIGDGGDSDLDPSEPDIDQHSNSEDYYESQKHLVLSPYQAYTYVSSHYFKATDDMLHEGGPLHPSRDPVEMFPSLKDMLVRHPDLDFFVDCLSDPEENIFIVNLHVRSLAKGIDSQFDNVIYRFSNATEETRQRKLYLMVQLGNGIGFSFFGWLFLKVLSLYFRLTETCRDSPMNLESTRDRYGFPGFRVGGLFKTYHFGGSLQTDPDKPNNYIGLTKHIAASYYDSFVGKIVLNKLQRYFFESTVDLTFVIEGEKNDELPERALSSLRIVHVNPNKVAKDPCPYLAMVEDFDLIHSNITRKRRNPSFSPLALHDAVQYSLDSVRSIVHSSLPLLSPKKHTQAVVNGNALEVITEGVENGTVGTTQRHVKRNGGTIDPLKKGIDLVIDILRSVMVPCRQKPDQFDPINSNRQKEDIVIRQVPALKMFDRSDIGRYIVQFDYDLRIASEQLIETALWRGKTFPIDKRRCRIELQNGQFFQQGYDKDNNPVFYFRNLCRGPWRGDPKATILAIFYRFDKTLNELCRVNPLTMVTIIVLMGHAKRGAQKKKSQRTRGESNYSDIMHDDDFEIDDDSDTERESPEAVIEFPSEEEIKVNTGNPRISPDEKWTCHTNKEVLRRFFEILIEHYPGRLSRILLVKGRGRNHYYRDQIQGKMIFRSLFSNMSKKCRQELMKKIQFVNKTSGLTQCVALKNLPSVVGGIATIHHSNYEFYEHQF